MKIIGGDGSGGYARTKPGRSFAVSVSKTKLIGRHKKTNATLHKFQSTVLNRVERVVFAPCQTANHKRCAKVVIQDDGTLPRICSCDCHIDKRKRRRTPTTALVGQGVEVHAVNQFYINEGKSAAAPVELPPVKLHDDLKALYAAHATALAGGKQFGNASGKIAIPKYFRLGGKLHSLRIVVIEE